MPENKSINTTNNQTQSTSLTRRLRNIVFFAGLLFIVLLFIKSWPELRLRVANIHIPLFALSLLVAMLNAFFGALYFYKLIEKFHGEIEISLCLKLFYFSQIAKYIPGKVWGIFLQSLLSRGKTSTSSILLANIDLTVLQIVSCTSIGLIFMLASLKFYLAAVIVFFLFAILFIAVSETCLTSRLLNLLGKRISRFRMKQGVCQPSIPRHISLLFYVALLICFSGAHYLLLISVFDIAPMQSVFYVALLALSWVIGVITLISPAGIGVREISFIFLANLSGYHIETQMLAAIAVISRIWLILQELIGISLIYFYYRHFTSQSSEEHKT